MSRSPDGFAAGTHQAAGLNWKTAADNSQFLADSKADVHTALLMDIRAELGTLNKLLHCSNFTKLPAEIRGLRRDVKALTKALTEKV